MAFPPPPLNSSSNFDSYFLLFIASFILAAIAITLLLNCGCMRMESLLHCFRSCCIKKEPKVVEIIPVCRYKEEQSFSTECSVCLTAFQEGEKVRQLPACRHSFHAPCVDMWLYSHSSCPSCRAHVQQTNKEDSREEQLGNREMAIAIIPAL
ncbi:RING-H2 finger protein ATL73-like [Phalaenopsis equestris]|uniref:RING-H2 finger protein ATL73-like n=1 Tax=Phalaenopsis equestris TaxID=78828 RepID=UPI0009E2BB5E|nr:RING-H2 finger protein ATL73-like [Phalaenopsis equestris]